MFSDTIQFVTEYWMHAFSMEWFGTVSTSTGKWTDTKQDLWNPNINFSGDVTP